MSRPALIRCRRRRRPALSRGASSGRPALSRGGGQWIMVGCAHKTVRVGHVRDHAAYLRRRPALIRYRAGCLVGRLRLRHRRGAVIGDRKVQVVDGRIGIVPPVLIEHDVTTRTNSLGGLVVNEIAAAVGVETCEVPDKSWHTEHPCATLLLVDERVCGRSHDDELARWPIIVVSLA